MSEEEKQSSPPKPSDSTSSPPTGLSAFWAELKRRKVMRVVGVYAGAGWVVMEVSATVFPNLGFPQWLLSALIILIILGFPVAMVVAWIYDMTPDGIRITDSLEEKVGSSTDVDRPRAQHSLPLLLATAAFPTVIFGVLAIAFFFKARSANDELVMITKTLTEADAISDKSIAVLPLENMSSDPDNAFFADGVQEDILTNLSKIEELDVVISRSSTLKYKDPNRNLKQVGRELGVRYIVEGSVRRAANQVLVTVQLIDSVTDDHIWAENYNRELNDIFAIQAQVAKEIARQLKAAISPEEIELIERLPTKNQEAYDYFLKASLTFSRSKKISLYEKAVELDPNFAEAWAFLACWRSAAWLFEKKRKDPSLLAEVHYALDEAIRINPNLPHVLYAQGGVLSIEQHDNELVTEYFLKALAVDPNFGVSQGALGLRYYQLGRIVEAQHHFEGAIRTDPLSFLPNYRLFDVYHSRKMWGKARALVTKNLKLSPPHDFWIKAMAWTDYLESGDRRRYTSVIKASSRFHDDWWTKIHILFADRDYNEALKTIKEIDPDNWGNATLLRPIGSTRELFAALISYQIGDKEKWRSESGKAIAIMERMLEVNPNAQVLNWSNLVVCYALNDDRRAMDRMIAIVREITAESQWKSRFQMLCEMHIAMAYTILDDKEKAIETLEAASEMEVYLSLNREIDLMPIFDRLRGNPRFDALLQD